MGDGLVTITPTAPPPTPTPTPTPTPGPASQFWTSAGSTGTVDEDSSGKLTYQDFTVRFANSQIATVRYNITAVDGISKFCPATQSVVSVRFRNSDATSAHSRVKFDIHRTNILTGGNVVIFTFDSNGTSTGSAFGTLMIAPSIDFDFANNIYWIEATIFRDDIGQFADLGAIEIHESAGTPCP
jgi:hypothetical protein